jgi:hypothetical protein
MGETIEISEPLATPEKMLDERSETGQRDTVRADF